MNPLFIHTKSCRGSPVWWDSMSLMVTRFAIKELFNENFGTLNTCDFLEGIDYDPPICVRLTDTVEGSLMGFKF
ncbi:MAG: hypothetical protein PVF58_06005 [Candidatus Methanofastidiosia archaeon]